MYINRLSKQVTVFIAGFIAFFFLLGYAGTQELTEQIVYTMPQEVYDTICLKLGDKCSDKQIADEYMSNKKYYDSLAK